MAKKEKTLKIKGYTNLKLKVGKLFSDSIVEAVEVLYNDNHVNYCDPRRYAECKIKNSCDHAKLRSISDSLSMVGKKHYQTLTEANRNKIERMLAEAFEKCRAITITAELIE